MSGVAEFLIRHAGEGPVSFHMPGHKGSQLYRRFGYGEFLDRFFDCDITEIPGADNLFQAESIIAETMDKYRRLYDTRASYLLINGTSGGLIASIMTAVAPGKKLIMARNCHKAVFNALTLGNIQPLYAHPSEVAEYGIAGPVEPEEIRRLLAEEPDAEAVILPSPNYYGICSDIRAIAEEVHEAGKLLIVDQAHGAHLKFFEGAEAMEAVLPMPQAAESCGADLVVNSVHKTLGSLTQSAVLNVCSERVDLYRLEDKLQAIESTSPSYILMGSLDISADILREHGDELMGAWRENLVWFYEEAQKIPGLKIMGQGSLDGQMDLTKINLDMSGCGLDGGRLEEALMQEGIFAELVTGDILMCMTGLGNTREDYVRLIRTLQKIAAASEKSQVSPEDEPEESPTAFAESRSGAFLWTKRRPLRDLPAGKELLPLDQCEGRICASSIIPYPPGIPLICPGEELGAEEIAYVKELRERGEKVMGIDGQGRIVVGV
ncbi:MAG: aminotransferase class V-fold PLP-dependent enzyme [Firmicutes bacterium]|nr:aminotransferase class V-fold PLP-dependent enzyme [Bacillota bacterium]